MRVLIDTSSYLMNNNGDKAMLQVAVGRLAKLDPKLEATVLTTNPSQVRAVCPEATPFPMNEGYRWYRATHARDILDTLEEGIQLGKPTAIMGCGFEPVQNRELRTKAKAVLPKVSLIAYREKTTAPGILHAFGVSPNQMGLTGDDAIEPAYDARSLRTGDWIGVNIREAEYTGLTDEMIETVRLVLHQAGRKYRAALAPIPISIHDPSDLDSTQKLLVGYGGQVCNGARLDTPLSVIHRIGQCRAVVTGSYHGAVFALSQGIVAVGLASTLHYVTKMEGLTDMFGGGCVVVRLNSPTLHEDLTAAIDAAWEAADRERLRLLEAARQQIEMGQKAYQRLYELVK